MTVRNLAHINPDMFTYLKSPTPYNQPPSSPGPCLNTLLTFLGLAFHTRLSLCSVPCSSTSLGHHVPHPGTHECLPCIALRYGLNFQEGEEDEFPTLFLWSYGVVELWSYAKLSKIRYI